MPTSYGALCTDFFVNHDLAVKMDLPADRETVLHLFDRVRRSQPEMDRFKRYDDEFLLESGPNDRQHLWAAVRQNYFRSGFVNPETMEKVYQFHKEMLAFAPYHLTISPLDVDYQELMFGFDLECKGNHDEIIAEALFAESPLAALLKTHRSGHEPRKLLDVQPMFRMQLCDEDRLQACVQVKTRQRSRKGHANRHRNEPITIWLNVRRFGPLSNVDELPAGLDEMSRWAEQLTNDRLVPYILNPIARLITSGA